MLFLPPHTSVASFLPPLPHSIHPSLPSDEPHKIPSSPLPGFAPSIFLCLDPAEFLRVFLPVSWSSSSGGLQISSAPASSDLEPGFVLSAKEKKESPGQIFSHSLREAEEDPPPFLPFFQMGQVYLDRSVKPEPAAAVGIPQGNQATNLVSAGWTDERHTDYISSMEASFIHRLYSHGRNASRKDSGTNGFKVLQGGVWTKLEFERSSACAPVVDKRRLPANPWIQHFRSRDCSSSTRGDGAETSVGDHESGIRTVPGKTPLSHVRDLGACKSENLLDENTEVSDQNFADDEAEVDEESSIACKKRRLSSTSTYCTRMIK